MATDTAFVLDGVRAKALHFRLAGDGGQGRVYAVTAQEPCASFDNERLVERFAGDMSGPWWLVYIADCFDPPLCVVGSYHGEVEEVFLEHCDWADIDPIDLPDYLPDKCRMDELESSGGSRLEEASEYLQFTQRGTYADTEAIVVRELRLVRIDLTD